MGPPARFHCATLLHTAQASARQAKRQYPDRNHVSLGLVPHGKKLHQAVILAQGCSTCDAIDGDRTLDCWNLDTSSVGIAQRHDRLCGAIG